VAIIEDEHTETNTSRNLLVRVTPDLHAAIKRRADAEERTIAQTVRRALRLYLEEQRPA
jgi:predicted HicB family RNase H-like nuclease